MEPIRKVEDVLNRINRSRLHKTNMAITELPIDLEESIELIEILANEIKEIKRIVTTQGLLIKHEEEVRLTKATRQPAAKNIIPKFKKGDRVVRIKGLDKPNAEPLVGTVKTTNGDRAFVRFNGEGDVWVAKRSIIHWKLEA